MTSGHRLLALLTLPALALTGCGGSSGDAMAQASGADGPTLSIVTSFYPLQFVTGRVAGARADVGNLTKPGAEPHDLELTPGDVAQVSDADLVVYLHGFQPAVDDSVQTQAADHSLDVEEAAKLDIEGGDEHAEEEHAEEEHAEEEHGGLDPHFWLDPTRLADVADVVADRLADLDPDGAAAYAANAGTLRTELLALDGELSTGLAPCTNRTIVTSHEAFAYLAQRYDLTQLGIAGLSPEAEPDAATLAEVADFVRANSVSTIYYETLVSPAIAQTVAAETGAKTAVLDPLEGLSDASAAQDYFGVMRANLAALRAGQSCG